MGETNVLCSLAVGLAFGSPCYSQNNGKATYGNFLFFLFLPVKRICWKGYFFTFHIFFKIIMKDKWFNILQTYKITSKIRHYFKSLLHVTRKLRSENSNQSSFVHFTRFHSLSNECNDLFHQACNYAMYGLPLPVT